MELELEMKLISTEIIKPSSSTPKSLQKHKLSLLDQLLAPLLPMPYVYFYSSNIIPTISNSQKSNILKNSLSETLSRFYPLAGRLVDNLYVDCNDAGAPFAVAEINCHLSHVFTSNPNPKNMSKFLPYKLYESYDSCISVQATYFRCGGLAVGILISHKIGDALSFINFSNTWSAVARNGGADVPPPKFDAAAYFPPRDFSGNVDPGTGILVKEEIASRIFTFPAAKIAILRERYSAGGVRPSRTEAVSAYILTRFASAKGMKIYSMSHIVNIRTRTEQLSDDHFGNLFWFSIMSEVGDGGGVELVKKFWAGMQGVDEVYVNELRDGGEKHLMNSMEEMMVRFNSNGDHAFYRISSLCGFPLYEADFGWGKPVWVGQGGFPFKNVVIFWDTKSGGGIEALVHLSKQDMVKFQDDLEFQLLIKSNL